MKSDCVAMVQPRQIWNLFSSVGWVELGMGEEDGWL